MIQPTSNYLGYNRTNGVSENLAQKNATSSSSTHSNTTSAQSDQLSSSNTEALRNALNSTPEVRPEVVSRGQALAKMASYPPLEIINSLAKMIISSQDLSE